MFLQIGKIISQNASRNLIKGKKNLKERKMLRIYFSVFVIKRFQVPAKVFFPPIPYKKRKEDRKINMLMQNLILFYIE